MTNSHFSLFLQSLQWSLNGHTRSRKTMIATSMSARPPHTPMVGHGSANMALTTTIM